jgi:hypothetical protein
MKSAAFVLITVTAVLVVGCGTTAPSSQEPKANQPAASAQGSGSRATPNEEPAQEPPDIPGDQAVTQPQGTNTNLP